MPRVPGQEVKRNVLSRTQSWKLQNVFNRMRTGVRSTTAAAILTGLGFEHVSNPKGGMLEWSEARLPVER